MRKVSTRVIKKADLDFLEADINYVDTTLSSIMDEVSTVENKITEIESQRNVHPNETTAALTRFSASISDIGGRLTTIYNRL